MNFGPELQLRLGDCSYLDKCVGLGSSEIPELQKRFVVWLLGRRHFGYTTTTITTTTTNYNNYYYYYSDCLLALRRLS